MDKINVRVAIFIGVALTWSLIWVSQRHRLFDLINTDSFMFLLSGLVPTFGLIVGSFLLRKKLTKDKISLTGNNSFYSIIILAIPILCLSVIGVDNNYTFQKNIFGFVIGTFTMVYAFFEEYGWRGYLQEELSIKFNKWSTYTFIGIVWYLWHWYFLREGSNPKLIMLPILIGASVGIGEVSKSTKSLLVCTSLHGIVNILIIYRIISNQLSNLEKGLILVVCLAIWIPLIKKLEKAGNTTTNKN